MKPKILICIPSYTFGGAENHSKYIGQAIVNEGNYEVYFLAFGKVDGFDSNLREMGFETLHFPISNFFGLSIINKVRTVFRLFFFLRRYRFSYFFSGTKVENILLGLLWKPLRIKKFFWQQWSVDDSKVGIWEKVVTFTKPYYLANSRSSQENLIFRLGLSRAIHIPIIHNTFNEELLRIRRDEQDKNFNLVMVANFYPEKDYITVIKAFKLLKNRLPSSNIKLYCVGISPGMGINTLIAKCLAFDLKLKDDIIFTGKVRDISKILELADIGILSTKSEGLSNAIIEYMCVGIPTIVTDIEQNNEALGITSNEWSFKIGDYEQCSFLIEKLYMNAKLCSQIGNRNKHYVVENYNKELFFEKITDLIK